jgi:hypothetical protein
VETGLRPIAPYAERRPACSAVAGGFSPLPKTIVTRVCREGKKNRMFAGLGPAGRHFLFVRL